MVGSEYIQAEIISSLQLMNVVGNVRQPVGRFSAAFNQYGILIFPKLGGFKPYRSILVIGISFLPDRLHGPVDGSILIKRMLIEEGVHFNIHPLHSPAYLLENGPFRFLPEDLFSRLLQQRLPIFIRKLFCDILDILPFISAIWQFGFLTKQLVITGLYTLSKNSHLPSGVVEVVLSVHIRPAPFEQACYRISQHRISTVPDRQGALGRASCRERVWSSVGAVSVEVTSR